MRGPIAILLALCGTSALGQSTFLPLLEALNENGFTRFSQQLEGDPILTAGPGLIIYAPTNAALEAENASGPIGRRQSREDLLQARNSIHAVDSTAPRPPRPPRRGPPRNATRRDVPVSVGSAMVTLLDSPEFVNLGQQSNQVIVEKSGAFASLPIVYSGLGRSVKVTGADIPYAQGVIRPIDGVITLPESVSTTLPFLGTDIFLSLLDQSGLLADLDARAAITILAPDDTAFARFDHASLSADQLRAVLQQHVLVDYPAYSPLLESGDTYATLAGGSVSVLVRDGVVFWNGARLLAGDAILRNGLVHVIDRVMGAAAAAPLPTSSVVTGAATAMREPFALETLVGGFAGLVGAARYAGLL